MQLLMSKISAAFDLVRKNVSKHHAYKNELYDQRVHGQPFNTGDWVWLYSPAIGRGGSRKLNCIMERTLHCYKEDF